MYVCMYVCMYACMHACMYVCMYVSVCLYVCMSVCLYVCMSVMYVCMCMYVCMYACMYVCMYVCVCVYVCMCMYVCMYVCMYACMYVCMYVCMHACMYVCVCVCMYVCMHACMYVCMWTIWRDVKLLSFAWECGMIVGPRSTISYHNHGILDLINPAHLPCQPQFVQFLVHGDRLSQEPACRFFKSLFTSVWTSIWCRFDPVRLSRSIKLGAIWLLLKGKGQLPLDSIQHWLWRWQLPLFFRSFQWPTPARLKGLFLHVRCIPQQNSQWQFWANVWLILDSSRWHEPFGEYLSR